MAQIPYMNWMGDQPTGSAYDVYQYYLGGGGPGGTSAGGGGGGGTGIMQAYQPTGDGGGGGFQLPQNYYKAPNLGTPVRSMTSEGLREYTTGIPGDTIGLPQDNKVKNYLQNLNFPGKKILGAGLSKLKTGLGGIASLAGGFLPEVNPAHASNLRWAVDDAGYGTGTQRDPFGMLTGQSLMDPDRTYGDRLTDREDELNKIIAKQKTKGTYKKTGWHQRQLEHIKSDNKIKEKERDAEQQKQESLQAQVTAQANREAARIIREDPNVGRDYGKTETRASDSWDRSPFEKGGMITDLTKDPEYRGWKKMYEANPGVGSMHEKHKTFIKFYKQHERDKKKFGGLAGLLYG